MHSFIIIHMVTARHIIWNTFSLIQIFSRIAYCKIHNFKSFPLIQIFFNKWIMSSYCLKIHLSHFTFLSRSPTSSLVNLWKPWYTEIGHILATSSFTRIHGKILRTSCPGSWVHTVSFWWGSFSQVIRAESHSEDDLCPGLDSMSPCTGICIQTLGCGTHDYMSII